MGWVHMGTGSLAGITGQPMPGLNDPLGFYENLFPGEGIRWDLYEVEFLGKEVMDGVQTEHLKIEMDFAKILRQMGGETKAKFSEIVGGSSLDALGEIQVQRLEIWVDDLGYTRRTIMEMDLGRSGAMAFDMRMFDFNEDITDNLPENYVELSLP
ncbi:MAG: hypothetical protein IH962_01250 [Chloroflexi bacterium]|nr:hypothetical protein [Chloroflexota bacterium]